MAVADTILDLSPWVVEGVRELVRKNTWRNEI